MYQDKLHHSPHPGALAWATIARNVHYDRWPRFWFIDEGTADLNQPRAAFDSVTRNLLFRLLEGNFRQLSFRDQAIHGDIGDHIPQPLTSRVQHTALERRVLAAAMYRLCETPIRPQAHGSSQIQMIESLIDQLEEFQDREVDRLLAGAYEVSLGPLAPHHELAFNRYKENNDDQPKTRLNAEFLYRALTMSEADIQIILSSPRLNAQATGWAHWVGAFRGLLPPEDEVAIRRPRPSYCFRLDHQAKSVYVVQADTIRLVE